MSLVEARERHARLMNPPNAVPDHGIDLKRKPEQPVNVQPAPIITPTRLDLLARRITDMARELEDIRACAGLDPPALTVQLIVKIVADKYGTHPEEVLSKRRNPAIVRPRHIAFFLAKTMTRHSYPELGKFFSDRDHTTILHGVHKIEALRAVEPDLERDLVELRERLTVITNS